MEDVEPHFGYNTTHSLVRGLLLVFCLCIWLLELRCYTCGGSSLACSWYFSSLEGLQLGFD
jgi:hypothetical protein